MISELINQKIIHSDGNVGIVKNLINDDSDNIIEIDFNGKVRSFIYEFAFKKKTLACVDENLQKQVMDDINKTPHNIEIKKINPDLSLFELMDEAAKENNMEEFAKCFWHSTNVNNLIEIYRLKKIEARETAKHIPYDNKTKNTKSMEMLNAHRCKRVFEYVRLYFRPGNSFFFNLCHDQGDELVLIGIDRDKLINGPYTNHTILFPFSAVNAQFEDLNWKHEINKQGHSSIFYRKEDFNFSQIYGKYNKQCSSQLAECLVYKSLSIYSICHLYFKTSTTKEKFLSSIKPFADDKIYNWVNKISKVRNELFYTSFYE